MCCYISCSWWQLRKEETRSADVNVLLYTMIQDISLALLLQRVSGSKLGNNWPEPFHSKNKEQVAFAQFTVPKEYAL
jgi:hypothetical protein